MATIIKWEADRYWVKLDGDTYLVELGAYSGNGACNCRSFECVHQPKLERGDTTIRRCKHLVFAISEAAKIEHNGAYEQQKEVNKAAHQGV